jgi:hypothetical protein
MGESKNDEEGRDATRADVGSAEGGATSVRLVAIFFELSHSESKRPERFGLQATPVRRMHSAVTLLGPELSRS